MKLLNYLCCIIFVFSSCQNKSKLADQTIKIVINPASKTKIDNLKLLQKTEFIKLEKTGQSLIGNVRSVKLVDERIFVQDYFGKNVFIFSYPNGKFLNKIESRGNGPGEYIRIESFQVNSSEKTVEILDIQLKKIFKYKFNGEYLSFKKIPFYADGFINTDDGVLYSRYSVSEGDDLNYQLVKVDNDGDLIEKYVKLKKHTSYLIEHGNRLLKAQNDILFLPINSRIIYNYNRIGCSEMYYLDFGKHWSSKLLFSKVKMPSDIAKQAADKGFVTGLGFFEYNSKLLLSYWYKNCKKFCVYDNDKKNKYYIASDDRDLFYKTSFYGSSSLGLLSIKSSHSLMSFYEKNSELFVKSAKMKMLKLSDDDNPVLMITKI